ncbi:hypothetical protein GAYE_SCF46G5854 [Galdieria yellowstonensis]|uniref:Uncharacterized protein n=1 Tax=Galdieria yellowstonensis TaxID=3028027 RepID=A0AAV9IKN1_9RHOD|nr:hypothetical protein GAYE_SCF46G5854 [Galdieria yellowstonensis]
MSQKESLLPYSSHNYNSFVPRSSRNGVQNVHPNQFSDNTGEKTFNDCLSLSTSHCVRMLKQRYQRKSLESNHRASDKYKASSQNHTATISRGLPYVGENENSHKHSLETENNDISSPTRKTRIVSINDEEFATYREALAKQANIENQSLSSKELEQLYQQQVVFQGKLGKIQENLQTLEEMLKEAQYDRKQRDMNIQSSMQRSEDELKTNLEEMKNKISSSIQETKQLLSLKLSDLQNICVEIHSCLLASTEIISNEPETCELHER